MSDASTKKPYTPALSTVLEAEVVAYNDGRKVLNYDSASDDPHRNYKTARVVEAECRKWWQEHKLKIFDNSEAEWQKYHDIFDKFHKMLRDYERKHSLATGPCIFTALDAESIAHSQ